MRRFYSIKRVKNLSQIIFIKLIKKNKIFYYIYEYFFINKNNYFY